GGLSEDGRSYEEANVDNRIRAAVNTLLVKAREINSMDIDVTSREGVVTLEGEVPSRMIAYRAQSLAASVEGVKRVINRLRIAP
ncbi:MAG: BON domain-containing protein, partial [Gammaproteobacteria bacterium]|nr:BON domain-containing protein [Gammaproteobacteria bacterium]